MGNCRKLVTDPNRMISCPACNKKFQTFIVDEQESYHNGDISYKYEIDPNEQVVKEGFNYFCIPCYSNLPKLILESVDEAASQYLDRAKLSKYRLYSIYRKDLKKIEQRMERVKNLKNLILRTGGDFRNLTDEQLKEIHDYFLCSKLAQFIQPVRQRQLEELKPRFVDKPVPKYPMRCGYEFDRIRFPYYALVIAFNPDQARELYEKDVCELKDSFDAPIMNSPKMLPIDEVEAIIGTFSDQELTSYVNYVLTSPNVAATILIDRQLG